ncbi:hypothetical protein Nepgr_031606 [Nepenthes gracilis]|uniref:WRKY domain-containing protein n=1 Tax=Nepenthes gracilis TaxID=150966 RepID=A0AAD3TH13_NEPGR|nr:hypothetical protein Nepgr_031606 [Nepenthes gracilis]
MEANCCGGGEHASLIEELTRGFELAKQLKPCLGEEFPAEMQELIVEQILSSYDRALLILDGNRMTEPAQHAVPSSVISGSPISFTESPRNEALNADISKDFSKKRKATPSWREQVKVNAENGLEGPPDDGYSWRKYGQKDILGAKYPRSYFRCTHRSIQDCWATKQVQRSDHDPTVFDITYKGNHTCRAATRLKPGPTSPKKEPKQSSQLHNTQQCQQSDGSLNFQTWLTTETQNTDNREAAFPLPQTAISYNNGGNNTYPTLTIDNGNSHGIFSPSFMSPATSESNHFYGGFQRQHHSESDITEIISASTSGTNSPIVELDFYLDPFHFNRSFQFDDCPEFFP